jgi:hypothetical protein
MKSRLHHILILSFVAITAMTVSSFAQESGMPEIETTDSDRDKVEKEKVMYSPGESDTHYHAVLTTIPGDSVTTTVNTAASVPVPKIKIEKQLPPAPKPTVEKQSKPEDDSILSFNFLYYIIQKYKLQDIVD